MKVYISYPHRRRSFAADIAGVLRKNGYEVSWDHDLAGGSNWAGELAREISDADAIVMIYDKDSANSQFLKNEVAFSIRRRNAAKDGRPLLIPIFIGSDGLTENNELNYYLSDLQTTVISSEKESKDAADAALIALQTFEVGQEKAAKENKQAQERLDKGIRTHVEQVLEKLTETEKRQKRYAGILYAISAVMLLLTMGIAVVFISRTDFAEASLEKVLAVGVVYLFLAILVVSLSKFLFTLAKSFMVEAIRCSDRIHAISFGKFYIEAFEEKVSREEVMKIFSTWNIDNGATSFRNQTSEDYDPKLHELLGLLKHSGG